MGTKQVCIMLGVYYSKEIGRGLTQINAEVKGKRRKGERQRKKRFASCELRTRSVFNQR